MDFTEFQKLVSQAPVLDTVDNPEIIVGKLLHSAIRLINTEGWKIEDVMGHYVAKLRERYKDSLPHSENYQQEPE